MSSKIAAAQWSSARPRGWLDPFLAAIEEAHAERIIVLETTGCVVLSRCAAFPMLLHRSHDLQLSRRPIRSERSIGGVIPKI
jgi:hypothetical protein